MEKPRDGTTLFFKTLVRLDAESIMSQIAKEEHFVEASQSKKDPNAVYIEFGPKEALDKLLHLSENENYPERYKQMKQQ